MGKIVVSEFLSLDGVMEAPDKWHFPFLSDDMMQFNQADIRATDAMLMGRVTYQEFAAFWPTQINNEFGIADKLNHAPKFVVSATLEQADWHNSTLIRGNVAEEIGSLKQRLTGNIGITGSATLVQALHEAGLIDEYRLLVHPIIVGSGKHLFQEGTDKTALKLVETKTFSSGVVALIYRPDR